MAYVSGTINLTKTDYTTPILTVGSGEEKAAVSIYSESLGFGSSSAILEWSIDGENFYAFGTSVLLSNSTQAKEGIDVRGVGFLRVRTRVAAGAADPSAKFAVNTA